MNRKLLCLGLGTFFAAVLLSPSAVFAESAAVNRYTITHEGQTVANGQRTTYINRETDGGATTEYGFGVTTPASAGGVITLGYHEAQLGDDSKIKGGDSVKKFSGGTSGYIGTPVQISCSVVGGFNTVCILTGVNSTTCDDYTAYLNSGGTVSNDGNGYYSVSGGTGYTMGFVWSGGQCAASYLGFYSGYHAYAVSNSTTPQVSAYTL